MIERVFGLSLPAPIAPERQVGVHIVTLAHPSAMLSTLTYVVVAGWRRTHRAVTSLRTAWVPFETCLKVAATVRRHLTWL